MKRRSDKFFQAHQGLDFLIDFWQYTTSYFNVGNLIKGGTLKMKKGAVAEKEKLIGFTCLVNDNFTYVMAKSPTDADVENRQDSVLIIQGLAEDIGATHVSTEEVSGLYIEDLEKEQRLKEEALCTLFVGDPVRIAGATYCGKEILGVYEFLIFTKNGIKFWAFSNETRFSLVSFD